MASCSVDPNTGEPTAPDFCYNVLKENMKKMVDAHTYFSAQKIMYSTDEMAKEYAP